MLADLSLVRRAGEHPLVGPHILILSSDPLPAADPVHQALTENGYDVVTMNMSEPPAALLYEALGSDMILLALQAGDTAAFDVYSWLRERWKGPLLILASSFAPPDVLRVFENGADGYIPLPCNARVLLARIEALLRRSQGKRGTT